MWLLRRGGARADALVAERDREHRRAMVEAARRADERHHRSQMHDSVLATLGMVATGAVRGGSPVLARNAREALEVLEEFSVSPLGDDAAAVDLIDCLNTLAVEPARPVTATVHTEVARLPVPGLAAHAIIGAAREALRNVAAHSGVVWAEVRVERRADEVAVSIVDWGRGFDPALVPAGRYGLGYSIRERMALVGGTVEVESAPGQGTAVTLRWSGV